MRLPRPVFRSARLLLLLLLLLLGVGLGPLFLPMLLAQDVAPAGALAGRSRRAAGPVGPGRGHRAASTTGRVRDQFPGGR